LLFTPEGKILGAQAVGGDGTDKRIDVIATAIAGHLNVRDYRIFNFVMLLHLARPKIQ
jgi:hypothetical protein